MSGLAGGSNSARATAIHTARVHLAEARRRRGQLFAWTLLAWAANARRRAAAIPAVPVQGGLF
jgi:hypothetical protein